MDFNCLKSLSSPQQLRRFCLAGCATISAMTSHPAAFAPELLLVLVQQRMPFGKYQGRLLADLPLAYLTWFARQGWPPGQLGQCLALAYEIKHNGLSEVLTPLRKDPAE